MVDLLLVSAVFGAALVYLIVKVFVLPRYHYAVTDLIPGPKKHWLYGTLHVTQPGPKSLELAKGWNKQYGGIIRQWRGPFFPIVIIYHPEAAQTIFRASHPKGRVYGLLSYWLGEGLLTSHGDNWQRKRKMLTPAFHFNILKRYCEVFSEQTQILLNIWREDADAGRVVDITQNITLAALDMIGKCAFSYDIHAQDSGSRDKNPFVKSIYAATDLVYLRAFNPLLYNQKIYYLTKNGKTYKNSIDTINTFMDHVINTRRATLQTEEGRELLESGQKLDFVDILLSATDENGIPLNHKEIRDECNTFMFEGHDTTSMGLSWAFYLISKHPEVEKKIVEEVREILGDEMNPTQEQLKKLKYTVAVIKETLRLYPSVPTIARSMTEDTEVVSDGKKYIIQKGVDVLIYPYIIHRQEAFWPDPEAFIPERHLDRASSGAESYAYVPFSAGPRNCIGQNFAILEETAVLALILRDLHIEVLDDEVPCDPALV
eukprot:CAMPEP_0184368016 /NCGR_PEP_ID=MMETSP1089-20130417/160884_1 /TAXON_ID=38269 ORGANISM="Gloeochaete wittrockiana, Strain SAG46.84" /NCGR_SAMPLE_ID=MMETSP1089 /ASSEMBLY_ACC=CAM_ASM_000445 /LENGTH=486 /DNA_ID=CAMNT_0026710181 /DNA_START=82 /DNA_END=1539 /DNA_ORIENTATION=-